MSTGTATGQTNPAVNRLRSPGATEPIEPFLVEERAALEQQKHELLYEKEAVQREREALECEKDRMTSVCAKPTDIIKLNVGGREMHTTRATLCADPDTLLASMFSGRWENLPRDDQGRVFLNFNPDLFSLLLDHLRVLESSPPGETVSLPSLSGAMENATTVAAFSKMLEYLGFTKLPTHHTSSFVRALSNTQVELSNSDKHATRPPSQVPDDASIPGPEPFLAVADTAAWHIGTVDHLWRIRIANTDTATLRTPLVGVIPEGGGWLEGFFFDARYSYKRGVSLSVGVVLFKNGDTVRIRVTPNMMLIIENENTLMTHTIERSLNSKLKYRFALGLLPGLGGEILE